MFKFTRVALVAAAVLVSGSVCHAGWNPVKTIKETGGKISKSVKTEAGNAAESVKKIHGLNYEVRIINPTRQGTSYVFYTFEGDKQIGLTDGIVRTHRGTKVGQPVIRFDNGRGQSVSYSLPNGTYEFKWVDGVLNLYKK